MTIRDVSAAPEGRSLCQRDMCIDLVIMGRRNNRDETGCRSDKSDMVNFGTGTGTGTGVDMGNAVRTE